MSNEAKCSTVAKLLNEYLDDALPADTRQGAEAHLKACAECTRRLRDLRCTRRLLRRLPHEAMPDPMKTTLLDALRHHRPSSQSPPTIQSHDSEFRDSSSEDDDTAGS